MRKSSHHVIGYLESNVALLFDGDVGLLWPHHITLFGFHSVNVDVYFLNRQAGRFFNGVTNFVNNALGDLGNVHTVDHTDVKIHDQPIVFTADVDTLISERAFKKDRTQALTSAAFYHAGNTVAGGNRVTDEVGEILLRDLNTSQMIIDSDHIGKHTFL